ncbi:hypothetical protein LCGC14_0235170 [marine sediment metagenome]|uniref:HNH nuclease domain-containing protein n=1 Tax=marine sediment metagenome TaxID=412755 RepID=A0A0F9WTN5_9ZZZZ
MTQIAIEVENIDYVVCRVCGRGFEILCDNGHLKIHDMTVTQYREKYPGAPTISQKYREKTSGKNHYAWKGRMGRWIPRWREGIFWIQCLECGKRMKRVGYSHLRIHDMTPTQYLEKHPGAPTCCQKSLENVSGKNHCLWNSRRKKGFIARWRRGEFWVECPVPSCEVKLRVLSKHMNIHGIKGEQVKELYPSAQLVCRRSHEIRSEIKIGPNNGMYGQTYKCQEQTKKKIREARKQWYQIHSEANVGPNNPAWKGGVSFEPYGLDWTDPLKQLIRNSDDNICQMCGKVKEENTQRCQELDVHHIDFVKMNCDPSNLITLCRSCHLTVDEDDPEIRKVFYAITAERDNTLAEQHIQNYRPAVLAKAIA